MKKIIKQVGECYKNVIKQNIQKQDLRLTMKFENIKWHQELKMVPCKKMLKINR